MASSKPKDPHENLDTGFADRATDTGGRLINADGSFNIVRSGGRFWQRVNLFHSMVVMPWWKFFAVVFLVYGVINAFFAQLYLSVGMDQLAGHAGVSHLSIFWEAFFFSAQTLTTVGYGRVSPVGMGASILASLEGFIGLMVLAVITGLLYGRFSRPNIKMLFSEKLLVAPYGKNGRGLMFRLANARTDVITDITIQFLMSWNERGDDGRELRKYFTLDLERSKINFLALSWTVVHPIAEGSPLYGLTARDLAEQDTEFLVLLNAYDETYNQTVSSRTSYKHHQMLWNARFLPMFARSGQGSHTNLDLNKIDDVQVLETKEALIENP